MALITTGLQKLLLAAGLSTTLAVMSCSEQSSESAEPTPKNTITAEQIGFTDTPFLPDANWRVHDANRPHPTVVAPGGAQYAPPSDAIILFDGSDLSEWTGKEGRAANWLIEDGAMVIPARADRADRADIVSARAFGDVQLHLEWRAPLQLDKKSQGRGNSGIFFMERYEVQILDSYENITYADGQASALYGWKPPLVNAARAPGEWQSYDIIFEAPEFAEDGALLEPAFVTVFHNGVLTQHRQAFLGATTYRAVAEYSAHEPVGRLLLQDHSNPVAFRNIWVRELKLD